jgi:hypothetical protein
MARQLGMFDETNLEQRGFCTCKITIRRIMIDALLTLVLIYAAASVVALVRRPNEPTRIEALRRWGKVNWVALGFVTLALVWKFVRLVIDAVNGCALC